MYRLLTKHRLLAHKPLLFLCALMLFSVSACGGSAGIFGGGQWQASGLEQQPLTALAVAPQNPSTLYAGSRQGAIFVSNDAGVKWQEQSQGLSQGSNANSIHTLTFDASGKKLYAATAQGIFVQTLSEQRWQPLTASTLPTHVDYTALAIDVKDARTLFVGTVTRGVFVSLDGGTTWIARNAGLPTDVQVNSLTYVPDLQQLWAATSQGIYRSDDKGEKWQAFNNGLSGESLVIHTVMPLAVSGGAKEIVYAGAQRGFFVSRDEGKNWSQGRDSLANTTVHAIALDFRSSGLSSLFIGTNVGVLTSDDYGQTWSAVAGGTPRQTSIYALTLGDKQYGRLYAAATGLYVYPGQNSGDAGNIWPIILFLGFFALLYYLLQRKRRRQLTDLDRQLPEEREEASS